ncbi:MAG: triose-phosphate isomerase [Actinobacteria bacterium]|jgi:triosephosphate isomerase|nr:triose-phosphate isomerase [Actinomycetota bacterium]MCL6094542.1 triose-phosphate isomerase [Actinomycetota bacterium]
MGRKLLVSGNWKMNYTHLEAITALQALDVRLNRSLLAKVDVSIHPPFTALRSVQTVVEADDIPVMLGAQNCHFEDKGAYTGEVSPSMLAKLGVQLVIVGHSERRTYFHETDDDISRKLSAVLRNKMIPMLCVGESLAEREEGATEAKLESQLRGALAGIDRKSLSDLVVAYEPIWAIGTGRAAYPDDAEAACRHLRSVLSQLLGSELAEQIRLLYGGSVDPDNTAELVSNEDVDGVLVGGASLDPEKFAAIIKQAASTG